MPYEVNTNALEAWARDGRRVLINGPPNSGKTTSLHTWPGPLVALSYPGERGSTRLGLKTVDEKPITSIRWKTVVDGASWIGILAEIQKVTHEAIKGVYGPAMTFAGEGLHKLYDVFLNVATNGALARGEDFDPVKYRPATQLCFDYIRKVLDSNIPNVVFTAWDGYEKDDVQDKAKDASQHVFPELPGKAAKRIMGEFPVVLYANREGAGPAAKYVWQTQPFGRVWGAGIKMPLEIALKLPVTVPQDWAALEKVLIPSTLTGGPTK